MPWSFRLNSLVHVPLVRGAFRRLVEQIVPGALIFEVVRTRFMDDVLRDEVGLGARQLVLLGAGYDSRAYRFADLLDDVGVFEVDHPVSSRLKRERVRKAFGSLPDDVSYVEIDFESQDLAEILAGAGYDEGARTLFIWSGVAPYISEDAVVSVLDFVREGSGPGSIIVFDYIYREFLDGDDSYFGAKQLRRAVEGQGEPFRSGIPAGGLEAFVGERGLELARAVTAADFPDLAGQSYDCGGICVARTPGF